MIGVISDTHGLLRPEAIEALRGCELILHAGDIGKERVLEGLREIAPVVAVRGNVDTHAWAADLAIEEIVEHAGRRILLLHNVRDMQRNPEDEGIEVVVSGHSHIANNERKSGVLYFNPGSAGPRRFRLPVMLGLLRLVAGEWVGEIRHLEV